MIQLIFLIATIHIGDFGSFIGMSTNSKSPILPDCNRIHSPYTKSDSPTDTSIQPIDKLLKLLWQAEIPEGRDLPLVKNGFVYLPSGKIINGINGDAVNLPNVSSVFKPLSDSILVYDNKVNLRIINIKSGVLLRKDMLTRNFFLEKNGAQFLRDSIYITLFGKNSVRALQVNRDKVIWTFQSQSSVFNKPFIYNQSVFIFNKQEIVELDKLSGRQKSAIAISDYIDSTPLTDGHFLYVFVHKNGLKAFDLRTKTIVWTKSLEKYSNHVYDIEEDSNAIYFSNFGVYAVDKIRGTEKWKLESTSMVGAVIRSDVMALVNDYLIFYRYKDGERVLTVCDKKSGRLQYQGLNSSIIQSKDDTGSEPKGEDVQYIEFVNELIDNKVLVGKMGNRVFGFEILARE